MNRAFPVAGAVPERPHWRQSDEGGGGGGGQPGLNLLWDDPYQAVVMFHMETHPTDQPAVAAELLPVSLQQLVTDRLLGLCHLETILNPPNLIAITGWSADPSENLIGLAEELCAQVLRALGTTVTVGGGAGLPEFYGAVRLPAG